MAPTGTTPKLTVYKASAGSGKTFRLVVEYLKLVLVDINNFRTIQAVTFTNKATAEMKERIFQVLFNLSKNQAPDYSAILQDELSLSEQEIQQKAAKALATILHEYHNFSVSTIDRFFQTIIRAFAHESGIFGNFSVELDSDLILDEAVDRVQLMADDHEDIRRWLLQTVEDRLRDGKGWNTSDSIRKMGKQLLYEINLDLFNQLSDDNIEKVEELKKKLFALKRDFEITASKIAEKAIVLMKEHQVVIENFTYKKQSFVSYFLKCAQQSGVSKRYIPGVRVLNAIDNIDAWCSKNTETALKSQIQGLYDAGFNNYLKKLVEHYEGHYSYYISALVVIKNIHSLGLTMYLYKSIREIQNERNALLLGEGNRLLRGLVGDQDAPFIFEKTGAFINHFMIDEFQDTSSVQWDILKPLVDNALASNNKNIVVGDVKQSIYRWRNGDWRILSHKIYDNFKKYGLNDQVIDSNYRSSKNVVEFNNQFFAASAITLQNVFKTDIDKSVEKEEMLQKYATTIEDAYKDIVQIPKSGIENGKIKLVKIEDEKGENDANMLSAFIQEVESLQLMGWKPSDICVLVRGKKEGQKIIKGLMEKKSSDPVEGVIYDFSTADSLLLSNSFTNRFIILFLNYLVNPDSEIIKQSILRVFREFLKPELNKIGSLPIRFIDDNQKGDNLFSVSDNDESDYFPFFKKENDSWLNSIRLFSPLQLVNEIIRRYNLWKIENDHAAVLALCDKISTLQKQDVNGLYDIINWWDEGGYKTSFDPGSEENAIKIMTIHKSKGLQFPIVLVPFCQWSLKPMTGLDSTVLWCKSQVEPFSDIDYVPVSYSTELANSVFANDYFVENLMSYVDNLNLLYVAFTRAVYGLSAFYIFKSDKKKSNSNSLLTSTLLENYRKENGGDEVFEIGSFEHVLENRKQKETKQPFLLKWKVANNRTEMKLRRQELINRESDHDHPMTRGNILHDVFSRIKTIDDVDTAINHLLIDGVIRSNEEEEIRQTVLDSISWVEDRGWFSTEWKVLNETSILSPGTEIRRPDRVLIKNKEAIVIDYKTGEKKESYKYQVLAYMRLLKEMGYTVRGYLWYVLIPEVVEISV